MQEEIISSVEDNIKNGKILFEESQIRNFCWEDIHNIEAAKKRKSKNDDDDDVGDDDYYNNDDEEDNPFDKEPDEGDLLDDFPMDDDDDLFDDEDDTYN